MKDRHLVEHCRSAGPTQLFADRKVFCGVTTDNYCPAVARAAEAQGYHGIDGHSVRVSGAVVLRAHLDPGLDLKALKSAGGWSTDVMAEYYGGSSAEHTRTWAWRMVRPALRLTAN